MNEYGIKDADYEDYRLVPAEPPGKNSRTLLFSIFLVLLAFFIMLNSISLIDARKKHQSLQSVQDKFSRKKKLVEEPDIVISARETEKEALPLSYFGTAEKIAREPVELVKGRIILEESSMRMLIPIDAFFVKDKAEIKDFQMAFMQRLADQMVRYKKIDIEFSLPDSGPAPYDGKHNLAVARAAAFAREMQNLGIDAGEIYTGVKPEDSNFLTIAFFLRDAESEAEQ